MFECLVNHGCPDLTSSIDAGRRSSSAIASRGFGDVRCVTLEDGTFVALKILRLRILLEDDDEAAKGDSMFKFHNISSESYPGAPQRAVCEAYVWSRLHHPNIQKLLGIIVFQGGLGMVSP